MIFDYISLLFDIFYNSCFSFIPYSTGLNKWKMVWLLFYLIKPINKTQQQAINTLSIAINLKLKHI